MMKNYWIILDIVVFVFLSPLLLVGCYNIRENRIPKGKEIILGSEVTQISYDVVLSAGSRTVIANVSGKSSGNRKVLVTYRNKKTVHLSRDSNGVAWCWLTLGIACLLEAPTLILRAWDTESTETEQESVPDSEKPLLVDDLKLYLCGQKLSLKAGKAIVQADSCENHMEPPQLLMSTGKLLEAVSVTPDLATVISRIQQDRAAAQHEKELYSKPHHWLYCGSTENSSMPPSVTQEMLKQFKLEAFDEAGKCEDTAWLKNQMAIRMGIGCICKYMLMDRKKAEAINGR